MHLRLGFNAYFTNEDVSEDTSPCHTLGEKKYGLFIK